MPSRKEVDLINDDKLELCTGSTSVFRAQDMPGTTAQGVQLGLEDATKLLNQETRFPERLDLRVGAQVMLIMVCPHSLSSIVFMYADTTEHESGFQSRIEC